MSNFIENNVLLTTILVSIAVIAVVLLAAFLKYKNVDIKGIFEKLENFLKSAETYTEAAEGMTSGKVQTILSTADALEKLALQGCQGAEQMLLSSQITDDADGTKRKTFAENYVYAFLQSHNITVNDNIKTIVQGIIQKTVLSDKTIDDINKQLDTLVNGKVSNLNTLNASLQTTITQLTADKATLQQQVTTLTAKLNNIQVQATQA